MSHNSKPKVRNLGNGLAQMGKGSGRTRRDKKWKEIAEGREMTIILI